MKLRQTALAAVVAAVGLTAGAEPRVSFEQGFLTARMGRGVIGNSEVRSKLQSGLSTTFVIAARGEIAPPARRIASAVRVEVRYDLWDEVFIVSEYRPDRSVARGRVPSIEALSAWWDDHAVRVAAAAGASQFEGELELRVLPFSFSEERDAQGWLSRSLGLSTNAPVSDPTTGAAPQSSVLDALIATSIRAKPIAVRRWRVTAGGGVRR